MEDLFKKLGKITKPDKMGGLPFGREIELRWVDIEKELHVTGLDEEYPHASEMILLSDGEFVYYGQYENSKEFGKSFIDANGDDFADDGVEITHWMPMPEPPSVGKV